MPDAWRAYLDLALGLTEAPRKKAQQVAGELLNRGGATAAQVQGLVEDLLSAGIANREALTNIVRYEVDRALGRVGLATAEEVSDLTTKVRGLERQLRDAQARVSAAEVADGTRLEQPAPVPQPARKAVAKKALKAKPNAMPAAGTEPAAGPANAAATPVAEPAPVKRAPA
jgi:polyhydroxyalkanoate synthesis regulator phasin